MENQNYCSGVIVCGDSSSGFIPQLAQAGTILSNYQAYSQGIGGCSHGCYEAFTAGNQLLSDGGCPKASSPCSGAPQPSISKQLQTAGLTSALFCEDDCPRGSDHFPWIEYADTWNSCVTSFTSCTGQTGPTSDALYNSASSDGNTAFINYLNGANPASYIWFTPTDSHNMHDNSVTSGDAYVQNLLVGTGSLSSPSSSSVLGTSLWKAGHTLLYLWWDENSNPPMVLYGPMVKAGYTAGETLNEYYMLHLIENNWGLPAITSVVNGDTAPTDLFTSTTPLPLSASFTATPNPAVAGTVVSFTATATGGTPPYTYTWSLGDRSTGTGQTTTHTYSAAGNYSATLTVTDSASPAGSVRSTQTVKVNPIPPLTASFTFNPTQPTSGQSVTFTGTGTGGVSPYTFNWRFGDGGTGSGQTPSHTYASAGAYTVTLNVTDTASAHVTASRPITVSPLTALIASFTYSPTLPGSGQTVTFTASASGGTAPYTFSWSFGDGSTSAGPSVTHVYSSPASFTVVLTAKDSGATQQSATSQQTVIVSTPASTMTISFRYNPSSPTSGEQVSFTATASGGTAPYTYNWSFGDGSSATGATVAHTYTSTGSFSVILAASDSSSPRMSATSTLTLTVVNPKTQSARPTYTLTWMGFDWDGSHEETLTLNGQTLASLPAVDSPQNGQTYTAFALNITSLVLPGTNTVVMTHSDWDCGVVDSVTNLQVILQLGNQTQVVYSNPAVEPLSCTQPLTLQFVAQQIAPKPSYTLTWMGFDWDGGHEETLTLNGQTLASLPAVDSPQNGQTYTPFRLDITPLIRAGSNILFMSHAGWDCAVSDNVKNLQVTFQMENVTEVVYSDPTTRPLSCGQSLTYTFTLAMTGPTASAQAGGLQEAILFRASTSILEPSTPTVLVSSLTLISTLATGLFKASRKSRPVSRA